jgi:TnpA family transposase
MTPRQLLSPQSRAALFDPPTDPAAIVRHYTFSPDDLSLIRQRRRDANRLGFAVHLAYLRFPGRVIGVDENPPLDMLRFIAEQIGVSDRDFEDYATRSQTRRAHLSELQAYLGIRPFRPPTFWRSPRSFGSKSQKNRSTSESKKTIFAKHQAGERRRAG